ncbi:hypothetical protein HY572_04510 [Candidatus Micrarchaeota archaeon]|nr:hypothetical protein [Candidatus Micrarchaeota archaeon]
MRSISWKTYAAAFAISAFLFAVGILTGAFIAEDASNQLASELSLLQSRTGELEVLLLFNPNSTTTLCPFYQSTLSEFDLETTAFGVKIDALEHSQGPSDENVLKLKREYTLKQVRDYLLTQKIKEECGAKTQTLLYFYTKDCAECLKQGLVGPPLKKDRPELLIYALDSSLNMPAVNALKEIHQVTRYPTLVLNAEKLEGFHSKEQIESRLDA